MQFIEEEVWQGTVKREKHFAFLPTRTNDDRHTVWWEHYYKVYRYIDHPEHGLCWYQIDKELIEKDAS